MRGRIKSTILVLLLQYLSLVGNIAVAEQTIEEIVRSGVSQVQGVASNEDSGKLVPNYSRNKALLHLEKISLR